MSRYFEEEEDVEGASTPLVEGKPSGPLLFSSSHARRRRSVVLGAVGAAAVLGLGGSLARRVAAPSALASSHGGADHPTGLAPGKLRKIFYINCAFSEDRRAMQEAQLPRLGVPFERFDCVSGDDVDEVYNYSPFVAQFKSLPSRIAEMASDPVSQAHSLACGFSHWVLYDRIARLQAADPEGLYLILEDDARLPATTTAEAIEEAAAHLPRDWTYASLNVHESVCEEDRVNDAWFVKRGDPASKTFSFLKTDGYPSEPSGECTPRTLDSEWGGDAYFNILYLSSAAELVRPKAAQSVLDWLQTQPIYHVDASLRTPDVAQFASYQSAVQLFQVETDLSEARSAVRYPQRPASGTLHEEEQNPVLAPPPPPLDALKNPPVV